jgi:hypothetical protein
MNQLAKSRHAWPQFFAALLLLVAGGRNARADASSSAAPTVSEVRLIHGGRYRARLRLGFVDCLATRGEIRTVVGGRGFARVQVFMSARELPADWPLQYRSKVGHCERYIEGTWRGITTTRKCPPNIDAGA